MKSLSFALALSALLFSCSKKDDTNSESKKEGIARIEGHFSGGSLSWEKTTNGDKTTGTDAGASFDIAYKDKKAFVTVTTTAPLANKTYQLPLITPETSASGYVFQLVENTDVIQNNSALRITITTKISGQIDFYKTDKSGGNTITERYTLSGDPQNN